MICFSHISWSEFFVSLWGKKRQSLCRGLPGWFNMEILPRPVSNAKMVVLRCLFWGDSLHVFAGGFQNGSTKRIQKAPKQFIVIFLDKACCNREFWKGNVFCHMTMNYERIRHIYWSTCKFTTWTSKNHQIKQKTLWFKESITVNKMERFLIWVRVCFEWLEPTRDNRPFVAWKKKSLVEWPITR